MESKTFHPTLPNQHFVGPMPAKTLLAAISEEGDVRIEWFEKWWGGVRERIDGTPVFREGLGTQFVGPNIMIVIQALVQGKLFAEKWYMFSDYK